MEGGIEITKQRIVIPVSNRMNLVAEQNTDPAFEKEILIFVETKDGHCNQMLALVGLDYEIDDNLDINWKEDMADIRQWLDPESEDYTTAETVKINKEEE